MDGAYRNYGTLYEVTARLYGVCYKFSGASFLEVDGSADPINWPRSIIVEDSAMTTTGVVPSPAAEPAPASSAEPLGAAAFARP
jgi:hypothetical protein